MSVEGFARFWSRRRRRGAVASPVEEPLAVALEMVRAAASARSSTEAVSAVVEVLARRDERVAPLAAVHLAVFLGQPSPSARRTTPAETAAWVDNLAMQLEFDALVAPLRAADPRSEG